MRRLLAISLLGISCLANAIDFSEKERQAILQHGPWPPPARPDPSNRVSGKPEAIAFGERLFFEPRLSGPGSVLCATCHAPGRAFQDGKPRAFGLAQVERNTPSVLNVRYARWFGWDGAHDSLWSQSIRPLLEPKEMNASAAQVMAAVNRLFPADYRKVFKEEPSEPETVLANVGKALAAYQETLVTGRTPFDQFRDALQKGEVEGKYPPAAQRGLRVFVGKGGCASCHSGPAFTNGDFAATKIAFAADDSGRLAGIKKLKSNQFNLLGRYNDDPSRSTAAGTRDLEARPGNAGEFRVPSLRNAANTAPYMHDGSLATLGEVLRRHSQGLAESEIADLVAFLESLSEEPRARGQH